MSLVFLDTKLSQKFQEALPLSVAKKYTKLGGDYQNRLADWFTKGDGVTKISNKNHRLYIPIIKLDQEEIPSSEIETEVRAFIDEKSKGSFDEIDYAQGLIFPKGKKVPVKIGKTLTKLKAPNHLINDFVNDPFRFGEKGKKNDTKLFAVITRHPVDIAGMASDRKWDSCKDLGTKRIVYSKTGIISKKGEFSYKIKTEVDKLLVAYLVRDDDLNIKTPVARFNILPYTKGDITIYKANAKSVYQDGSLNEKLSVMFIKTVQKWINKKNGKVPIGTYETNEEDIYLDNADPKIKIRSDKFILGTKYEWNEFDYDQQKRIENGIEKGLDVSWYADPKYSIYQMRQIKEGLEDGVDVSIYADTKYDEGQMEKIREGLEEGIDISKYADPKYNAGKMGVIKQGIIDKLDISQYANPEYEWKEMYQIKQGLEQGLDVSWYANPKFNYEQMYQIQNGLKQSLDVSWYANPKFNYEQMYQIQNGLKQSLDVSWYANPKFDRWQMEEIREGLEDELDVSQYADPKFSYTQMRKIKKTLKK